MFDIFRGVVSVKVTFYESHRESDVMIFVEEKYPRQVKSLCQGSRAEGCCLTLGNIRKATEIQ